MVDDIILDITIAIMFWTTCISWIWNHRILYCPYTAEVWGLNLRTCIPDGRWYRFRYQL